MTRVDDLLGLTPRLLVHSVHGQLPARSPLWSSRGVHALLDVVRRDALLPALAEQLGTG